MEFNKELLINFAPILLTFGFTVVTLSTVFCKLKMRWPIKANCWFCNYNVRIWRNEVGWWLCPFCSQYNGFSKDGDYKYPIPEQRKMPHVARFYATQNVSKITHKNYLCSICNNNEELKLLELRKFENGNSRTDKELKDFKEIIEEKYPICSTCKQIVNNVLHKQSLWLTRYKMMIFKQRPIKLIFQNGYKMEKFSRILLIIIDVAIIYSHSLWPLSIVGVMLQLGTFFMVSKTDKQEIFLIFLWIWIAILSTVNNFYFMETNPIILWLPSNWISKHHFIAALGSIIGFINIKTKLFKPSKKNLTFKKLDTSPNSSFQEIGSSENKLHSPVNLTNLLINSEYSDTETPTRTLQLIDNNRTNLNQYALPKCKLQTRYSDSRCFNKVYSEDENSALKDSLQNLSTLSLNQGYPEKLEKTSSIFETKTYSTSTCALFSKYNTVNRGSKKSILMPSKLKSMTSSWVAGGYWQTGMDPASLSRSSSQSSGLGSAGSNLGPSREPSVYNDYDQCSIVSAPVQCCCSTHNHKLSQVSLSSDCRFNSSLVRPTNSLPLTRLQEVNSPTNHDQYMKISENIMKHLQQTPIYSEHTTVITSPFWLPVLLCSSLIINITVLWTVLLH